jgi:hypothetical protein
MHGMRQTLSLNGIVLGEVWRVAMAISPRRLSAYAMRERHIVNVAAEMRAHHGWKRSSWTMIITFQDLTRDMGVSAAGAATAAIWQISRTTP